MQKFVEDPLSEALIEGRLTDSSLIEIYLGSNSLGIRPLAEEGLAELKKLADGGVGTTTPSRQEKMALR